MRSKENSKLNIVRHAGAVGFLSMIGLTAAMIPLALYSLFADKTPTDPLIFIGASVIAGAVVGWVLKK